MDSAVLRLTPLAHPVIAPAEEDEFRSFVQAAFGMRRKQMRRVLRELWSLDAAGAERILDAARIDPAVRPETLSPLEFVNLLRAR